MAVITNPFALDRHFSQDSGYSSFLGTPEELGGLVNRFVTTQGPPREGELVEPGTREGVLLVNIPVDFIGKFRSSLVKLKEGDQLVGHYAQRSGNVEEQPRKLMFVRGAKPLPASTCQVVIYSSEVLAETGHNSKPVDHGWWEIVSVNVSPYLFATPIPPTALIYNQLGLSGGTSTGYDPAQFLAKLEESVEFWCNHAHVEPVGDDEKKLRHARHLLSMYIKKASRLTKYAQEAMDDDGNIKSGWIVNVQMDAANAHRDYEDSERIRTMDTDEWKRQNPSVDTLIPLW